MSGITAGFAVETGGSGLFRPHPYGLPGRRADGRRVGGFTLVTGGCRYIGRHLTELLVRRGYGVRVVGLQEWPDAPKGVEFWQGSILDRPLMEKAVAGVDVVFHLAANPNLWAPDPKTFHEVNYEGTI